MATKKLNFNTPPRQVYESDDNEEEEVIKVIRKRRIEEVQDEQEEPPKKKKKVNFVQEEEEEEEDIEGLEPEAKSIKKSSQSSKEAPTSRSVKKRRIEEEVVSEEEDIDVEGVEPEPEKPKKTTSTQGRDRTHACEAARPLIAPSNSGSSTSVLDDVAGNSSIAGVDHLNNGGKKGPGRKAYVETFSLPKNSSIIDIAPPACDFKEATIKFGKLF